MDQFKQVLSDKLKTLGATDEQLSVALHGSSKEQTLKSFNVYLAAHAKDNEKINALRSFTVKGQDHEILQCVDTASKALSKHVFNTGGNHD